MPSISPQVTPYYGGGQAVQPVDSFQTSGAPSSANINHNLGTLAVDNAAATIYGLASKSGGSATWIALGSNGGFIASSGTTSAMSGSPGSVTVSDATVTDSNVIIFSRATTGGTAGQVSITAQSAGSFTLTSTSAETSTFNYLVLNQG